MTPTLRLTSVEFIATLLHEERGALLRWHHTSADRCASDTINGVDCHLCHVCRLERPVAPVPAACDSPVGQSQRATARR
jgi:hypothetical protein